MQWGFSGTAPPTLRSLHIRSLQQPLRAPAEPSTCLTNVIPLRGLASATFAGAFRRKLNSQSTDFGHKSLYVCRSRRRRAERSLVGPNLLTEDQTSYRPMPSHDDHDSPHHIPRTATYVVAHISASANLHIARQMQCVVLPGHLRAGRSYEVCLVSVNAPGLPSVPHTSL